MATSGRKSGRIFIIIAILLIVLVAAAAVIFLRFGNLLQPAGPSAEESSQQLLEPLVKVVLVAQQVNRGEIIEPSDLVLVDYPENHLVEGTYFTNMDEVVGKKAFYPINPSTLITPGMIFDGMVGSIASFDIPVDKTALSLTLNKEELIAFAPQPGDHIMVIGCMMTVDVDPEYQTILPNYTAEVVKRLLKDDSPIEAFTVDIESEGEGTEQGRTELDPTINQPVYVQPSEPQRPRLVCQNVIQDAIIIRVGDFPLSGVEPTPKQESTEESEQTTEQEPQAPEPVPLSQIVTIAVSPQDAVVLTYMKKASIEITFALLNPNNDQITLTDAVTQQYLMDQKNIPLPAKLPFAIEPRVGDFAPTE